MDRPVGVFDSGVGGLTVLRELAWALPEESFVYFGDTARVPYGAKSAETVTRYSIEVANYLITHHDIKMLVVACNTASSFALPTLRKIYRIPVVGMIDPCVSRVASLARKETIGVVGTTGTIRSGAYEEALRRAVPSARVTSVSCPLLVPLAEEGWADDPVTQAVVAKYLAPLRAARPDALILGCTHYPVLKKPIREFMGESTELIDSGYAAARVVAAYLSENGLLAASRPAAATRFLVTDDPDRFVRAGEFFSGTTMADVARIVL